MRQFRLIPETVPTAGLHEIRPRVFANISVFPTGTQVAPDGEIILSAFTNESTFGNPTINTGTYADIILTEFSNVSTFGALQIVEAPPDADIRLTEITNVSTFGALQIVEAPPDGVLRMSPVTNTSTFGNLVISEITTDEDEGGPIASMPIADRPI